MTATPASSPLWAGACWPVPAWPDKAGVIEKPVISDGFKRRAAKDPKTGKQLHRQHLGVDIMFKNTKRREPKIPVQTTWFHCVAGVPMLAALSGTVWFAGRTGMGFTVQIDHGARYGFPLVTYYTHMETLLVRKGQPVVAGEPIGIISNNPATANDPNHCHFELWDYSRGKCERVERCLDPAPYLQAWQVLPARRAPSGAILVGRDA